MSCFALRRHGPKVIAIYLLFLGQHAVVSGRLRSASRFGHRVSASFHGGYPRDDPPHHITDYREDFEIDPHQLDPDGCPRNREEAVSKGRMCLRKCQSDADCISARKRCLCDGLCGWSCIRPDLHCFELTPVENGQFKVTGDHFGAHVTYTCNEKYIMSGPKERVCQGDGSWSEEKSPECKLEAMCGVPPLVPHARHNDSIDVTEFKVKTVIQYTCFPGYDAQGYPRATCLYLNGTTQWFGLDLRCIPRSCGHPGEVEHGEREGDIFTFTSRVTYLCVEGYELVGRANIYCESNGEWGGRLPSCRPVECVIPADPSQGRTLYTDVTFKSTVKYECLYGYKLVGPSTRTCGPNKQWEGPEPRCEEIDCGSPGILYNGHLKGSSTRFDSVIMFRCNENMTLIGEFRSTTCRQDGSWSNPLPKCMAPCAVPEVEHGRVNNFPPGELIPHGKDIEVTCTPQYELRYNNTPVKCNNASWTHMPTCIPARCKKLPRTPRNGMVIAPKTDHGMKALFRCKDGFKLNGPNLTECKFGKWSGDIPTCEEIYCPFPGKLDKGRVLLVGHMGMYEYRHYVRKVGNNRQIMYECDRHYILAEGPPGATCVDGKWSPHELPTCIRGSHPQMRFNRSVRKRREAAVRRQRRLDILRDRTRRPKTRGSQEFCTPLLQTPWMDIDVLKTGKGKENAPHGTVVKVTCGRGYTLNIGNRTARCVRGRWKPRQPECVTSPCFVPATQNAVFHHFHVTLINGNAIPHGEVITVSCQTGFQLMGPESLRCWYGEWTVNKLPTCAPGPCELSEIRDGFYVDGYRAGLTISHGSAVRYECKPNYAKSRADPIRCVHGTLQPHPPSCFRSTSPRLPASTSRGRGHKEPIRTKMPATDMVMSGVQRPCSLPQRLHNTLLYRGSTIVHPDTNLAEGLSPSPKKEKLPNGQENHYFPHATEVLFRCLAAFTGKKTTWKIVCQDGVWVGRPHSCEQKNDAPSNENLKNKTCRFRQPNPNVVVFHGDRKVTREGIEFPPETELVYRCRDIGKYSFVGSSRRRCALGQWEGTEPYCYGLSQENDYALERAPTILFRHQVGQIAQSNDGKLIVYPGTSLHLECLWIRKYGTPHWEVSNKNRKYPEGWTNEIGRDPQLEYRLSIYHAQSEDSGRYTCVTPMFHQHSVDIVVTAVHCPTLPDTPGLRVSTTSTKMNVKVVFSCDHGRSLVGSEQATCLSSGRWSAQPPTCQKVPTCPYPGTSRGATLSVVKFYYSINETVEFGCKEGYKLQGRRVLQCLDAGRWSSAIPACHPIRKG